MRTIEVKLFQFSELSDKAKERALEQLCDINFMHDWWDSVYEDAENIGLKITEFYLDRGMSIEAEPLLSASEIAANIIRDHGESCDTHKIAIEFIEEQNEKLAKYLETESTEDEDALIKCEEEFMMMLRGEYLIMLQNEYEFRSSEEAIIETIEANEHEFTEDGTPY